MHCDKSPVPGMKSSKSGSLAYTGQPPNYSSYMHQVAEYPGDGPDGAMILRHSFHAANTFRDSPGLGQSAAHGAGQQSFLRGDRSTATLPRNMGVLGKTQEGVTLGPNMGAMGPLNAPNGCAQPLHHTLPRPPPPPRVNSRASHGAEPGLSGDPQRDLRLPQAALSEMRV